GDRRLSRLAIPQDQLSLPASDRQKRIYDLEAGLERPCHGRAAQDRGSGLLHGTPLGKPQRTALVERAAERVDDTADKFFADGNIEDAAGALGKAPGGQFAAGAKQDRADLFRIQIIGYPKHAAL